MPSVLASPFSLGLLVSLLLALVAARWERWRHARHEGPEAAADYSGLILLAACGAGLWPSLALPTVLGRLLLASVGVFVVSALTDRWHPFRGLRFGAAVLAGIYLCWHGLCMSTVKLPFAATFIGLGWAGPAVTALWLALSGALFARAATIPRVSLGVGAMAAATLYFVCLLQPEVTGGEARALTLALTGACLGMFAVPSCLGQGRATAGGYVLGFVLGAAAILGALKHTAFLVALLPLMVFGAPVFGALYSWVADYLRGRRTGFWGRRHPHLHEILLQQGYSEEQVTFILLSGTAALCALSLLLVALIRVSFLVKLPLALVGGLGALTLLYVVLRLMKPAHAPASPPAELTVLGVRVHRVTMAEAMGRVEGFMLQGHPHMIVTSDAIGIIKTQDDPELRRIVNEADLVTADGAGVVLSARLLGLPLDVRVSGCDMVGEICQVAARLGRSVYLLGAAPGVAAKAAAKLREQAPGLRVAGCRDGYFAPEDEPAIIREIAELQPAALFVALGIPRQERWISTHMSELGVPVCMGVGGSFDVISGLKKRAPAWMQRSGLEWLYRIAREPSRLPRLWALPRIVLLTFGQLLRPPDSPSGQP
jgi:N-acetylglucosaminyldiphosphoundecaprenol N-acetyl-beta-D-mannosaminyltransferase